MLNGNMCTAPILRSGNMCGGRCGAAETREPPPTPTVRTGQVMLPVRAPACIALLPTASYTTARKPRGGSGIVSASARRALPLKRRSG